MVILRIQKPMTNEAFLTIALLWLSKIASQLGFSCLDFDVVDHSRWPSRWVRKMGSDLFVIAVTTMLQTKSKFS